jgi:hypothetical protein
MEIAVGGRLALGVLGRKCRVGLLVGDETFGPAKRRAAGCRRGLLGRSRSCVKNAESEEGKREEAELRMSWHGDLL